MKRPKIYINLGFPSSIRKHQDKPIDGVGVFRIEFMIATFVGQHPSWLIERGKGEFYLNKIIEGIETVCKAIHPKPVVMRFSDFKTNEYRDLLGGTEYELQEENPMMGWRGASRFVSEKFNAIFRTECQSVSWIRENYDNLWVMIPFVRTVEEAQHCLDIMREEGLQRSKDFKVWLMAETPAFVFLMDEFNKLDIDGYSIGSNDLCQFMLAVDRDNAELLKMGYFNEENPVVLKAIETIIRGAHKADKTCSICGECVSDSPAMIDKVLEFGIDSISCRPDAFNMVKNHIDEKFSNHK